MTIRNTKAMNLKVSGERQTGLFGKRKGRENCFNSITISKKKSVKTCLAKDDIF